MKFYFQSFKLSEEDSLLLTLYRTQAVVIDTWADEQVITYLPTILSTFDVSKADFISTY